MGMKYIIGYNPSLPYGEQWKEINVNSTADICMSQMLEFAIKQKYPDLYEKITEQCGGHFMKFDELTKEEFINVIFAVRGLAENEQLLDSHKKGLDLWNSLIEPLVLFDDRIENKG